MFWLDRNIPLRYREPIKEGILEWNKAFERIGFKDAIRVDVQPDDADFDTSDIRHASVRWQTVAKTSYGAIGPSVVDPRTGEILDADIGIDANNVRVVRNLRQEYLPPRKDAFAAFAEATSGHAQISSNAESCDYDDAATEESAFGMSLLEARGELDPDGPRRRQVRRSVPEERHDARGGPYARTASQFPRLDRLYRGRAFRPGIHGEAGNLGLGHGIQPVEPRREGRAPGRVHDVDTRAVRLLGDRVRLQADRAPRTRPRSSRRSRRARASPGSRIRPTRMSPTSPSTRR